MELAQKIIEILIPNRKEKLPGKTPNIREDTSTSKPRKLEQELDYLEGQRG